MARNSQIVSLLQRHRKRHIRISLQVSRRLRITLEALHAANMSYGTGPMARNNAKNMDDGWIATGSKRMNRVLMGYEYVKEWASGSVVGGKDKSGHNIK